MADNRTGAYGSVELLREQSHMTYYKLDEKTGEIIECPRLPADSVFLKRYLQRGMVIDRSLLVERSLAIKRNLGLQPVEKSQETSVDKVVNLTVEEKNEPTVEENAGLTCDICGKSAKNKAGLASHIRIKHSNH